MPALTWKGGTKKSCFSRLETICKEMTLDILSNFPDVPFFISPQESSRLLWQSPMLVLIPIMALPLGILNHFPWGKTFPQPWTLSSTLHYTTAIFKFEGFCNSTGSLRGPSTWSQFKTKCKLFSIWQVSQYGYYILRFFITWHEARVLQQVYD